MTVETAFTLFMTWRGNFCHLCTIVSRSFFLLARIPKITCFFNPVIGGRKQANKILVRALLSHEYILDFPILDFFLRDVELGMGLGLGLGLVNYVQS